ncbi:MAG: hypothetical protein K0T53_04135 [Wolbachia pipientis]|nr:hypothetical protein [Wolbachia pipientis]
MQKTKLTRKDASNRIEILSNKKEKKNAMSKTTKKACIKCKDE